MNVYFDQYRGNKRGKGMRPLRSLNADETFVWKGFTWQIAGAYVCSRGIVLDVIKHVSEEDLRVFQKKWKSVMEKGKMAQAENIMQRYENPFSTDMQMDVRINGKRINSWSSSRVYYNPFEERHEEKDFISDGWEEELMKFYKLDKAFAWSFERISLCWDYKRIPKHMVLSLSFKEDIYRIPCSAHVETVAGKLPPAVEFLHPITGSKHVLFVEKVKLNKFPKSRLDSGIGNEYVYPCHYQQIEYHFDENTPHDEYQLRDSVTGDRPIRKAAAGYSAEHMDEACAIGLIVGSDSKGKGNKCSEKLQKRTAVSRLKFEPVEHTIWQIDAIVKRGEEKEIELRLQ